MDLTITIPDNIYPRITAAFHGTYPNNDQTPDADLLQMAWRAYVRDVWLGWEKNAVQNAAAPRYDAAVSNYNAARQQIDNDIAAQDAQIDQDGAVLES